jgi:hypothetical protein
MTIRWNKWGIDCQQYQQFLAKHNIICCVRKPITTVVRGRKFLPMLNMAIPVPDLDMISTEPSNALGSSMCSLCYYYCCSRFKISSACTCQKKLIK